MRHGFSLKRLAPKKRAWASPALWAGITIGIGGALALALAPRKGKALRAQVKDKLTGKTPEEGAPPPGAEHVEQLPPPNR